MDREPPVRILWKADVGGHMFARVVSIKVKPGCEAKITKIFDQEVIPRFRQERDFLGLLVFTSLGGTEALSLSLWDQEKSAGANCPANLSALTALAGVVPGTPSVQVYKVSNSTLHTMKKMLGQGKQVEATPDLKVYQGCATTFPIVARTVHAELRFPARVSPCEFNAHGNPIIEDAGQGRRKKQFNNESPAIGGEVFLRTPGGPGSLSH